MISNSEMVDITLDDLDIASKTFHEVEGRSSYYDMALGLVQAGYEIEGCILLLATWNVGRFRFATKFDVDGLKGILCSDLHGDFVALAGHSIQILDLAIEGGRIERMFDRLASIQGVEYTGASKLLSLKNPGLFVMWDDYIRGGKPKKHYKNLPCIVAQKWFLRIYNKNGAGYVTFLRDIQNRFGHLNYAGGPKTLAKAIDEFNYVNVTLPMQKAEAQVREAAQAPTAERLRT